MKEKEKQKRTKIQFSSITESCPNLSSATDCSTPGFSVHHQLQELNEIHVHDDHVMPSHNPKWWCHPTISFSVISSSCIQSFPVAGSFQMSQLFTSGGQSIGVSASTSVLAMNTQDWSLGWTGWIFLQSKGLSRVFSNTQFKTIKSSVLSFLYNPTLTSIRDHKKNHSLESGEDR